MQQNWKGEERVGEEVYFTHSQRFRVRLVVSVAVFDGCSWEGLKPGSPDCAAVGGNGHEGTG